MVQNARCTSSLEIPYRLLGNRIKCPNVATKEYTYRANKTPQTAMAFRHYDENEKQKCHFTSRKNLQVAESIGDIVSDWKYPAEANFALL
jgi:hypothetical protein